MENKYLTVSALNKYIAYKFDKDIHLQNVVLKAEISNIRLSNGIMYFVLKDEESEIDALMFSNNVNRLKFNPIDGATVLVSGKINVYVKKGRYSITVNTMEDIGLGEAYLNFIRLKEKLETEGLFDIDKKLPIPKMSEKIGVITSGTGDALHDIVSTINKRFPLTEIYLYPALVQGKDAPQSLIKSLNRAIKDNIVDLIIIGRGGGSIEDLSCFNDEALARAIFNSPIPTISAVGHEADYTICDFVASLRAPTPTGAAVLATREKTDIINEVISINRHLANAMKQKMINGFNEYQKTINSYGFKNFLNILEKKEEDLSKTINHLKLVSPIQLINNRFNKVEDLTLRLSLINIENKIDEFQENIEFSINRINKSLIELINQSNVSLDNAIDKLILVNPLNIMKKGYTLTYQDSNLITTVSNINKNKKINIKYHDGEVEALITEVKNEIIS